MLINARMLIGSHDLVFITLDTLRYDVAQNLFQQGRIPTIARYLPPAGWEARHSPASFTYAAHLYEYIRHASAELLLPD